jgi:hypothetical protein
MTIVDVAHGCLEGKRYRHSEMYRGHVICLDPDSSYYDKQLCEHGTNEGTYCHVFPWSIGDMLRTDYYEVKTEEDLHL